MTMSIDLPAQYAWVWAVSICVAAVIAEGVLSGSKVKLRFKELSLPRLSLPLWAWSLVGLAYYTLFLLLLHSLLSTTPTPVWSIFALSLSVVVLAANAGWNWLFFRKKDLWLALLFYVPYVLAALALAIALFRTSNPLALWYCTYVGYLAYVTWWSFQVWRLNRSSAAA